MSLSVFIGATLLSQIGGSVPDGRIVRLDGTTISVVEAQEFAEKTLRENRVTGAQIAVLNRGQVVWSSAFGLRGKDPNLAMDRQTMAWTGSITKSVFSTYVMMLVEKGELDLDLPMVKQLKKPLNEYEEYVDVASLIVKDPAWGSVTPRMLLSHTSGLANFPFLEPDKKMHLHSRPGATYRYSGQGMNVLQLLIEEKKNSSLTNLMQEAIFGPLGMTRTAMRHRPELEGNIADRFDLNEKFLSKTRRSGDRAAGSMTSTADDLAKFVIALMDGKVLGAKARKEMFQPFIKITSLHQFPAGPNEPEGQEAKAVGLAYGMGWGLLTKTPHGRAFFKEGHGDGAQTYLILFEKSRSGIILITNSDNGELAYQSLIEKLLGITSIPWEWHGYTKSYIETSRKGQNP